MICFAQTTTLEMRAPRPLPRPSRCSTARWTRSICTVRAPLLVIMRWLVFRFASFNAFLSIGFKDVDHFSNFDHINIFGTVQRLAERSLFGRWETPLLVIFKQWVMLNVFARICWHMFVVVCLGQGTTLEMRGRRPSRGPWRCSTARWTPWACTVRAPFSCTLNSNFQRIYSWKVPFSSYNHWWLNQN